MRSRGLSKRPHLPSISVYPTRDVQEHAEGRVSMFQNIFGAIGEKIPEQISPHYMKAISMSGAIGTGVFVGIGTALRHAGPLGTLLAYGTTASMVWCMTASVGEMATWLPNVGGPVGLASIYVDPALGFALGWNAWYNWSIVLPAELSAAAVLASSLSNGSTKVNFAAITIGLASSVMINCFGARAYGKTEYFLSFIKITTAIALFIACIALAGASKKLNVLSELQSPRDIWAAGAFAQYRDIPGAAGRFLGFWTVMMQASYSFFGTEIPAIAAGEVVNPQKNIPNAVKRVWVKITVFYLLTVLSATLVVRSDDCRLGPSFLGRVNSNTPLPAGGSLLETDVNVICYLPKSVSAEYPVGANMSVEPASPFIIALRDAASGTKGGKAFGVIATVAFFLSAWSAATSDVYFSSRYLFFLAECRHMPLAKLFARLSTVPRRPFSKNTDVTKVPLLCVGASLAMGTLAYMAVSGASGVFHWLSSMTSATSLLSWISMLITYLRWWKAMNRDPQFRARYDANFPSRIRKFQPFLAWYALVVCLMIVICNGWYIFTQKISPWKMANEPDDLPPQPDPDIEPLIPTFITGYLPIPLFLLLILGYKLVYRSQLVRVSDLPIKRGNLQGEPNKDDEPPESPKASPELQSQTQSKVSRLFWGVVNWIYL